MGKYKKFNETERAETIILDKFVRMKWSGQARKIYEPMGYKYTKYLDGFDVDINDLATNSSAKVNVVCPVCKEHRQAMYKQTIISGHTLCHRCTKMIDVTGMKFGRWTAIEYAETINDHAYWWCMCECGEEKIVDVHSLKNGCSISCGCYRHEFLSSRVGELSPVWREPIIMVCEFCGGEYKARDGWDAKNRKFCSVACYGNWKSENETGENSRNWKGGPASICCEWCGNQFYVTQTRVGEAKFCSKECFGKWRSENIIGELHPNWNPDITDEQRYNNRSSIEYKQYTKNILERDNYTCQACGEYGVPMEVHHLYSHSSHPEYALDEDFGITLCKEHHKDFHVWLGGYGIACVPSDFDRWMYETM